LKARIVDLHLEAADRQCIDMEISTSSFLAERAGSKAALMMLMSAAIVGFTNAMMQVRGRAQRDMLDTARSIRCSVTPAAYV
jgi:hypothetical protein